MGGEWLARVALGNVKFDDARLKLNSPAQLINPGQQAEQWKRVGVNRACLFAAGTPFLGGFSGPKREWC